MAQREFVIPIDQTVHIAIELETVGGQVVSFVARLMLVSRKGMCSIARYDTAHGLPHLDLVNSRGKLVQKQWLLGMSFAKALSYAINDFKQNHEAYISQFKKR
jgi:hypothetical protein